MRKSFIFSILLIFNHLTYAQTKAKEMKPSDFDIITKLEDSISQLARVVVTDSIQPSRISAQEKLIPMMRQALSLGNSFNYAFDKIENISILYSPDKEFRILTWQLMITENKYKYFGFIQLNRSKSTVYELKDFSKEIQKPEGQFLSSEKWFGALYYNLKEFKTKEGTKYLLFGFNSNDTIEKIKICDVLTLSGGQARFGSPVFEFEQRGIKKRQNRLLFQHSIEASMRLNFDDEMNMVVHDHLTEIAYKNPDIPYVSVPDGTYEAFKLNKGVWQHIDKLENTIMDKAPIPKPVLGSKAKVVSKESAKQYAWPEDRVKEGQKN